MFRTYLIASILTVGFALSTAHAQSGSDLQVYAAFAKLEANVVESASALAMLALGSDLENREEFVEEFEEDAEAIASYVSFLEGEELGERGTEILGEFSNLWAQMEEAGNAIVAAEGGTMQAEMLEWWENAEAVDELVDEELEMLLSDNDVSFED